MLKVVEVVAPRPAEVKSDDDIPLSVDWVPTGAAGEPLYFNVEAGSGKGYLILRLEPVTGEIIGVVVVIAPNPGTGTVKLADLPSFEGALRVDRAPWDLNPDLVPRQGAVDVIASLASFEDDRYVYYALSGTAPVRKVMAGPVGFAIAEDDTITGIVAAR